MDVDTRLLRYFGAVAEEGNLTRAAERLYIAQPSLTKQIKQLENQLGLDLFVRSRSGMELTPAGKALADEAPELLRIWDRALRRARGAATRSACVLRVGFVASAANEYTPQIIAEFTRRRPGWRVELRQTEWSDPTAGLGTGDADAALLRVPFPGQHELHVEILITEPRWVALPAGHRLAHLPEVPFSELLDEPFVVTPKASGWWRDYWLAVEERDGRPARIGAIAHNPDEWLNAIAHGRGVSLTPEATARFYPRPDVVYRPVRDVGPSQVGVAWPRHGQDRSMVEDFVDSCLAVCVKGPAAAPHGDPGNLPDSL